MRTLPAGLTLWFAPDSFMSTGSPFEYGGLAMQPVRSRYVTAALAVVALLFCMLVAGTAFASVTPVEGESIAPGAFAGTWFPYSEAGLSAGNMVYSNVANSTLTFPFSGTGIVWISATSLGGGEAQVWVDSQAPQTVSTFVAGPGTQYLVPVFSWSGDNGAHVLHINVLGSGPGTYDNVGVDRLDVTAPDPVVSTPASSAWSLAIIAGLGMAAAFVTLKARARA